jgi:hypothetical protein
MTSAQANLSDRQTIKGKLATKMKAAQRHQKEIIRAVYPNTGCNRGYRTILTMQDEKLFAIPYWLTTWAGKLTPQTLSAY